MQPQTIKAAAAVKSTFSSTQYLNYGNIILNGYVTTASAVATAGTVGALNALTITTAGTNYTNGTYPNVYLSTSTGTFGYATVTVAGGIVTGVTITAGGRGFAVGQTITLNNILRTTTGTAAVLTVASVNTRNVEPVLKGWTNNYMNYFTNLTSVAPYGNYPGMDAGGFEFIVHSYKPPTGQIAVLTFSGPQGQGYTDGVYTGVATTTGKFGSGATINLTVAGGTVQVATINNPGTDYPLGTTVGIAGGACGPGSGFYAVVSAISNVDLNGEPYWSQRPLSGYAVVNSQFPLPGGGGGWLYPAPDSPVEPPMATLT